MTKDYATAKRGDKGPKRTWSQSYATYISGRAYIDEADAWAAEMEQKWGCGRLRLLVKPELREKFDRQRYLFNQAIHHGKEVEDIKREAGRMVRAWAALDRAATIGGATFLDPMVWEVTLPDGTVAALVPSLPYADRVQRDGRAMAVYTLEEIARLLAADRAIYATKIVFPGAEVVSVRKQISDPLDGLSGSDKPLDALVEDDVPF